MTDKKDETPRDGLDSRLGAPMKKSEGFSSDKKRAESEHLYAFREDVPVGGESPETESETPEDKA